MAEETQTQPKWEGKARVEIASLTAEKVWPCLEDFCNLHKWFPYLDTCYQVEGVSGQPGLVRYVTSTTKVSKASDEMMTRWANEKLIMINPSQRCFSYKVLENNIGFKSYVATTRVFPMKADEEKGCVVEWSFECEPMEGMTFENLLSTFNYCLQYMANKMEQAFLSTQ